MLAVDPNARRGLVWVDWVPTLSFPWECFKDKEATLSFTTGSHEAALSQNGTRRPPPSINCLLFKLSW